MTYVFEPAPRAALKISGSNALFPVRRVYCVGKNYAAHAREMGADPDKEPPFFFCKASDAQSVVCADENGSVDIHYAPGTENLHYEVELVVAIGKDGRDIAPEQAKDYIYGCAIGLDMTRRDLQSQMKQGGKPWEISKAFDDAAPIGAIHRELTLEQAEKAEILLTQNGKLVQHGRLQDLTWSIPEVIARLSQYFELKAGDIIFTGTPEGVGPVQRGDALQAELKGYSTLDVKVI